MTPDHAGNYTCYGSYNHTPYECSESSDPIDIKITGLYKKPSLSALMSPVVMSGENVTLSCISDHQFDMFHLSIEGVTQRHGLPAVQSHSGTFQTSFLLGPVIQTGNSRCYGSFRNSSHVWSSPIDPWYLPVTGIFKKPFLLALPTPLVDLGEKVTLECRSEIMFDTFILTSHKNGTIKDSFELSTEHHRGGSQANFLIGPVTPDDAETYTCYGSFNHSPYEWSESSDPIYIKITGSHDKPSLSACPSHIVPLGQRVELRCDSHSVYYTFKLYKELGNPIPHIHGRPFQRKFVFEPVTTEHAGTYRCYGFNDHYPIKISANSDPVKIIISGVYRKPFLLALQPPLVNLREKVTLECRSEIMFETFILTSHKNGTIKDSFKLSAEHYHGGSQANFSIGPVTPDDAGTYTCYGSYNHTPYEWSESGDPIDIKITGLYKKPFLSALMGPVVMSGENMTLTCFSDLQFDMFHLSRTGVPKRHGLPSVQNHSGTFQASFHLGPVVQAGNYRCYGSFRNSSHLWSTPSDPLYILVTDNLRNLNILIGLSVTMILAILIILLYSWCSAKKTIMDQDSEVRATLNRQDPEREEVQEVTYLKFDQMIFKQKLTTPDSQIPKEFSTDTSVYMEVRKC
ncbi:killer cell immunoglobulin-like receptor 3DL1 [Peromyscus maniculatus bairdii]|uniref:killer cell immunoglobulin-like receptor 3DL1 n=1 Tax=Peromyscus maniculatus bairdii TaxID=230844 RepID=UPI003FCFF8B4